MGDIVKAGDIGVRRWERELIPEQEPGEIPGSLPAPAPEPVKVPEREKVPA